MKLYHRPDCPFCWKVRIFLQEAGIDLQEFSVELGRKHPDVVALNPNGTVPVLIAGDLVLWESAVIIEYLVDKFPQASLMTGSPEQRAIIRQIHSYSDNRVGKVLFPFIKQVRESENGKATDELHQSTTNEWAIIQETLSVQLDDKDFFGTDFSVAECALIPRFTLALAYGLSLSDEFPNLKKWFWRCAKRPSFAATLPEVFPGIDEIIKLGNLQIQSFD